MDEELNKNAIEAEICGHEEKLRHYVKLLAAEAEKYGLKVKAAGGIRDAEAAQAMLAAGAERIGTSAGHKIAAGEA